MRSRKLLALLFCLITFPAIAGYMTLLGAGVGSIQPVASWVSTTDPTFPSSSLTFSRTSLATVFDSTGKLTYAPNNLLTYSNTFSNAAWSKPAATVTNANAVADPFGGTAASTVTTTAGNGGIYQAFSVSAATNSVASIWVRRRTGSGNVLMYTTDGGANSVIAVDGTWRQFFRSGPTASNFGYLRIELAINGDAVDVYGGTLSFVTYETTPRAQDQVITTAAAYYGPRVDYDPSTLAAKGLLIEEARTNLLMYSEAFSNAAWSKDSGAITASGTAPSGVTGSLFTPSAGSSTHRVIPTAATVTTATAYTATYYIAPNGYSKVALREGAATGAYAAFNLSGAGSVLDQGSGGVGSITALANGYYRIQMVSTSSGTSFRPDLWVLDPTYTSGSVTGAWSANGTSGIYLFGAQLEVGSFATSYIPTGASSVTRAADVVQFTGAALTALQGSAGSVIVQSISEASSSPTAITNVIKGTNSILYRDTTGKTGTTNGTTALLTAAAPTWSSAIRNGLAWSASGRSLGYTSSAIATDANTVSNGGTLYLGSSAGSAVESGWYQSLGIWNQRLPDATLSTKLTVGGPYAANDNANPFAPKFAANDNLPVHWRIAL